MSYFISNLVEKNGHISIPVVKDGNGQESNDVSIINTTDKKDVNDNTEDQIGKIYYKIIL